MINEHATLCSPATFHSWRSDCTQFQYVVHLKRQLEFFVFLHGTVSYLQQEAAQVYTQLSESNQEIFKFL